MTEKQSTTNNKETTTKEGGGGEGEGNNNKDDKPLTEYLERAEMAVKKNQEAAMTLHANWRSMLQRMGMMVMIVTFHQLHVPSSQCIKDIKSWNDVKRESLEEPISGWEAILLVLKDSDVELAGLICAACLIGSLSMSPSSSSSSSSSPGRRFNDFATLPYRLSCVCIPMIISLYYNNTTMSCLHHSDATLLRQMQEQQYDLPPSEPRGFPVILVFHAMATFSLWFMQIQVGQHDKNIIMVQRLKADLEAGAKKKKGAAAAAKEKADGAETTKADDAEPKKEK